MFSSQKSQIVIQTLAPYAVAVAAFCLHLTGTPFSELIEDWSKLLAIGLLSIAIGLLQDLIPKAFKEWLVFWRINHRLPGHRAFEEDRRFSAVLSRDEVIDIDTRSQLGARYQDRLFYRLYDAYREKGNVKHYSFRYLQWRELASMVLVSGIVGIGYLANVVGFMSTEVLYIACLSVLILFGCIFATRGAANKLVDYVLLNERLDKLEK